MSKPIQFNSPIHTCAQLMFNTNIQTIGNPTNPEEILTKAVYFGAIAAFSGKIFTHINPSFAALYGVTRGATEFATSHLIFRSAVETKEKRDQMTLPVRAGYIFLEIALTGIVTWGIFRGLQGITNPFITGVNKVFKKSFNHLNSFTFIQMAVMEASLVGMSIARAFITNHPKKSD